MIVQEKVGGREAVYPLWRRAESLPWMVHTKREVGYGKVCLEALER
jgi:hypothetical protein